MSDNPSPTAPAPRSGAPTPTDRQPIEVTRAELPLHCPTDGMSLWNSHPRVFLPIEQSGHEICPYCSAEYVLKDEGD